MFSKEHSKTYLFLAVVLGAFLLVVLKLYPTTPLKTVIISEVKPYIEGIERAKGFVYIGSHKLHEHLLPNPDVAAALEKVGQKDSLKNKVIVVLENYLTIEEQKEGQRSIHQGDSLNIYKRMGIQIMQSSSLFKSTHHKILVTQDYAYVGTTNFDKDFKETDKDGSITVVRDFSLLLTEPALIKELKQIVENDRLNQPTNLPLYDIAEIPEGATRLTWGPDQHYDHFKQLIKAAKKSIMIYQQALQDDELANLLVDAVKRGVKVSILMSELPFGPKHGNKSEKYQRLIANAPSKDGEFLGKVRLTGQTRTDGELKNKRLHIHAKVMIIDGEMMYLGSANFYPPALHKDRNLGLITRNMTYITPVLARFEADWNAHQDWGVAASSPSLRSGSSQ